MSLALQRLGVITASFICLLASAYFTTVHWWLESGRPQDVRRAAQWMPASPDPWRLMPQVEPERAAQHWHKVIAMVPGDNEARVALAQEAELAGNARQAEQHLLALARLDRGYQPAWALANYYLRQNQPEAFWRWARRAASFEVDLAALFQLCLRLKPDPAALRAELAVTRTEALEQLLRAAAEAELLVPAQPIAEEVARRGSRDAAALLLSSAERLLTAGNVEVARAYWETASKYRLLAYPVPPAPALVNGDFAHPTLEKGFDWRPGSAEIPITISGGLRASLWGKQDDTAIIIVQTLALKPGVQYRLSYRYRVTLPANAHPVFWRVGEAVSPTLPRGDWAEASWQFQAPAQAAGATARELQLVSQRAAGTHKGSGEVELAWVRLEPAR